MRNRDDSMGLVAWLALIASFGLALALMGCSQTKTEEQASEANARMWGYQSGNALAWVSGDMWGTDAAVLVDQETGVEYLVVRYSLGDQGGISVTPLLNADGTPFTAEE